MRILGPKEDLASLYGEARVFVAPTRYAAGIPHKAHEAAAHGIPMVVSPLLASQLGWSAGKECLVAGTPLEFAKACTELYTDESLWTRLREQALERVRLELNPEAFGQTVRRLLAGLAMRRSSAFSAD